MRTFTITEPWLNSPVDEAISRLPSLEIAADIGANAGDWSDSLSSVFRHVVAVEPDWRASGLIPQHPNVHVIPAAVSDHDGIAKLYMRATTGHNSLLEVHPIGGGGMAPVPVVNVVEVPCITLDSLLPKGANFIKIDIEGAEVAAIRGCQDLPRWKGTVFLVECHDTFSGVEQELARLGKRVIRIPHPLHAHPGHCWAIGE